MTKMEFDEVCDMAVFAGKKMKFKKLSKSNIVESIIYLMYLADKKKINLEDAILDKIEMVNKK